MATCEQLVSSETVYDYNCTPCKQRERFIEAKKFCVECAEYFCSTCLSYHEHFGATKGHTLVNCDEVSTGHVLTRLDKCKVHNKEEDMVCGEHDVVCCRVCIATSHRSCHDIDYLPKAAQSFVEGEKCTELGKDVKSKIKELQRSYNEHVTSAVQLKMRKRTHLKRLRLFKLSTTKLIEDLVSRAETDIEDIYEPVVCNIQKGIQDIEKLLPQLNAMSVDLENENDYLLLYKKALECKSILKDTQIQTRVIDQKMTLNHEFLTGIAKTVENSMKDDRFLGAYRIEEQGTMFDVPNMCLLPDGSLCIAHFYECKIIRMNNNLTEIDKFDAGSKVWGICAIDKNEIAFTIPESMKVQFLAYDGNPVIKYSFSTNIHCRGIAYFNENLYVAGGGFTGEESGQIDIFDLKGKLIRTYKDRKYFSVPRSVIVNNDNIYVTDCQRGVICLRLDSKLMWIFKNQQCKYPWGVCFTRNGNLLITGRDSNNILVVGKDGEVMGEMLNENDGLSAPKAICFDVQNRRLLISMYKSSFLKMFELEDCEI